MNNLTAREKGFMYVITLLIIVVLGYFFGIRTLNNKYEDYKKQLAALEQRKAHLEQIRANNASMETEIKALEEANKELELSFIDVLESETIEHYVLKTFEDAGCPYLTNITAIDTGMPTVTYPDGTNSPDGLVCLKINVKYVSTDGYTVPGYNRTPDFTAGAKENPAVVALKMKEQMGNPDFAPRKGYEQFIEAVKTINAANKSCIKVNSVEVIQVNAYLELNAEISFYGTSLRNRLSIDNSTEPYTKWAGPEASAIKCDGGFIGFGYICDNEKSLWYGCENVSIDYKAHKPFATYWANYLFNQAYEKNERNMKKMLNFGAAPKAQDQAQDTKKN